MNRRWMLLNGASVGAPAYDVTSTGGSITYRLQIAGTPTFEADSVYVDIGAIDDAANTIVQNVDAAQLPSGDVFARLVATPANQPERNWQVSGNKLYYNNQFTMAYCCSKYLK